jgi:hypothetical protein
LQQARVVFPDGSEFTDAPVVHWDMMLDLAIIGPLDTTLPPAEIDIHPPLDIASDVFLIGYPGEADEFPTPSISRGLISRLRTWTAADATYIQTDAAIAGGQSGGVLVSEQGKVIGISGFFFADSFALALSAADMSPRVEMLIAGQDPSGLGDRFIPAEGGTSHHGLRLDNLWDTRAFVINEPVSTQVQIGAVSENDLYLGFTDAFAYASEFIDDGSVGSESIELAIEEEGPYFVFVGQYNEEPGYVTLDSSHDIVLLDDPDDDTLISVGETVAGSIDFPYDTDYFNLHLNKGAMVEITVDSVLIDPYLTVDYPGATRYEIIFDDDSGRGLFDTNARLIYQAPQSGQYFLIVEDAVGANAGGYYLTVSEAPAGATPAVPSITPIPTAAPIASDFGLMSTYQSAQFPFSIQYPAGWTEQGASVAGTTAMFTDEENASLIIAEEDVVALGLGKLTQEKYTDLLETNLNATQSNIALHARRQTTLKNGIAGEILEFTAYGDTYYGIRLVYLLDGQIGFNATYLVAQDRFEALLPMIEYSFDTFTITE